MEIFDMKTKLIELTIVVILLALVSVCFAAWDNTKPADSDGVYTWPTSIRANWDALEQEIGIDLNEAHPYYQSAAPTFKPDGITAFDADDLGRVWIDSDNGKMYYLSATTPTWTSLVPNLPNNTYLLAVDTAGTGTVDLIKANASDVAVIPDGSELATSGAPTADADIVNKKYVDDFIRILNTTVKTFLDCNTNMPFDNTIPKNTEGDEVMTLAITPKSATNKLKIEVVVQCGIQAATNQSTAALFQDATANALAAGMGGNTSGSENSSIHFIHYMDAGTTSETTFKVRLGAGAGGVGFNGGNAQLYGGVASSSITITEIKG